jgi:flagellin-specific chaperone FliS
MLTANIQQQDEPMAEVESLIGTLSEGWAAIRTNAAPVPQIAQSTPAGGQKQ